jgi:hypothetical protein
VDSHGIIDDDVLEKLRLNCRSILGSQNDIDKELMDVCLDVIYNTNMKAYGLHELVLLYIKWLEENN